MPKFDFYPSFNAGEVSPLIDARTSLEKYRSACRTLENFQILPYGGAIRRPGTQYIGTCKYGELGEVRLIGFNFSTTTRYMIEMGVGYMRFWKPDGTLIYSSGTTPLEVGTPYTGAELREIQYVQINDLMYFVHENHPPHKLSRLSETNWTFEKVVFDYPPLLDMNSDEDRGLTFSGNYGTVLAKSKNKNLDGIPNFFTMDHIGSQWAVQWKRNVNNITLPIGGANWASGVLDLQGAYTVTTLGKWIGKIVLYRVPHDKLIQNGPEDTATSITRSGGTATVNHPNHGYENGDLVYISTAVAAAPLGDITLRKITRVDENTYTYTVANSGATSATNVSVENVSKMEKVKIFDTSGVERNFIFSGNEAERVGLKLHIESFTSGTDASVVIEASESNSGGTFTVDTVFNSTIGSTTTNQATVKVDNWLGMEWFRYEGSTLQEVRTTQFSEAAFSAKRGYPRAVCFHESRLCFGGTAAQPTTIWCSEIDNFENFKIGETASDAVQFTLAASEGNRIAWMYSQSQMLVGTNGDEWTIGSADVAQSLSATNVEARRQSSYGSKYMRAALVNDVLLFVQRNGRKVRELVYELNKDGWVAPDLTLLAEHITDGEIVELAYQQQPDAILWCVRGDGALIAMTYERDQKVVGWHRHLIAGAVAESVATIYGNGTEDEVWLVVRRGNLRTIERFPLLWREHFDQESTNAYRYLDCHMEFPAGTAGGSIPGLAHLAGQTITLVQNGEIRTTVVSSAGSAHRANANAGYLGLPYTSTLTPMKLNADYDDGTSQGRKKRIHQIVVRTLKSRGGEVQTNGGDWYDLASTTTTGDQKVIMAGAFALDADVSLRQTAPWPMCVLAITPKWDAYGNE